VSGLINGSSGAAGKAHIDNTVINVDTQKSEQVDCGKRGRLVISELSSYINTK